MTDFNLRFARQTLLPEFGQEGQTRLQQSRVLVLGAGGLGCPALTYLNSCGVGSIGIVDHDMVEISNLPRQILYGEGDIGKPKAFIAAEKLSLLNSETEFQIFNTKLVRSNVLDIFSNYDIVVDGSDNFSTRYLINDACVYLNKPFVSGSVFQFKGQVGVFNYNNSPTYRCLFPEPPPAELSPNCNEIGVIGFLPGIIGTIQAAETIKIVTQVGKPLTGQLMLFDALLGRVESIEFTRNIEMVKFAENNMNNPSNSGKINDISSAELISKLNDKSDIQLIDVREHAEVSSGMIGSAIHIPLKTVLENSHLIDRDKEVVVYCAGGVRSQKAIIELQAQKGFANLKNLVGGITRFRQEQAKSRSQ